MVADRTRQLLFAVTILVSVAVGVVIGGVFARAESGGRSPASTSASDAKAVVDAVDAVRAELVRVRERLDAGAMSVAPSERIDTRSSAAPDMTTEINKATAALVQAADSLRSASIHAGGGSAPLVAPKAVDPAVWSELEHQSPEANNKTYLLWNYQQVLDRFGPPERVGKSGMGSWWMYAREGQRSITFQFNDGLVAYVTVSD